MSQYGFGKCLFELSNRIAGAILFQILAKALSYGRLVFFMSAALKLQSRVVWALCSRSTVFHMLCTQKALRSPDASK